MKNIKYLNSSADNVILEEKFDLFSSASCFHWFDNSKIAKLVNNNLKKIFQSSLTPLKIEVKLTWLQLFKIRLKNVLGNNHLIKING